MKNHKGYSLLELIIVLTIIGLASIAIIGNFGRIIVDATIENSIIDMAKEVISVQHEARSGNTNIEKRTFNLEKADIKPHQGVIITTQPPTQSVEKQCSFCPSSKATLCVSGETFCHSTKPVFIFNKFSGELSDSHAIFALSKNRSFALLISQKGDFSLAELINGEWRSRTDLQQLLPSRQKNEPPTPKDKL